MIILRSTFEHLNNHFNINFNLIKNYIIYIKCKIFDVLRI